MNIIEEIETVYNEFVEQNNKQPDIAYVKVQWDDDKEQIDYIDEIAVNGVDARIPDDDILFYCNSVDGLKALTKDSGIAGFKVVEFIGFDKAS